MKSIELQTTQNVLINYELASLRDRIIAFVIDITALGTAVILLSMALMYAGSALPSVITVGLVFIGLVITFYTLLFEAMNKGQTLGKMAMRIQVVRLDSEQAVVTDYLLRWVFRLLDVWFSFGAFAVVLISSSPRAQRLGDLVSNTVVVRATPRMSVVLADVLRIDTAAEHTPVYPAVRQFREHDMLLIKQVLDRLHRHGNQAHREAMREAAVHTAQLLDLPEAPSDHEAFLRTLIKDYIVLTR